MSDDEQTRATGASGTAARDEDPVLVDARGLACPLPVIELARAIRETRVGARVRLPRCRP